ncbi:MAG: hypothetical protein IPL46_35710 [Saprospiraceae bacterium]|nr:hypothetical protein [Saprospiraceae bacterium]
MKYILLLLLSIGITALAFFNKGYKKKYLPEANIGTAENQQKDQPVPVPLQSTDSLKHTEFVLSLDNVVPAGKNIAYTPTLLLAWDEIEKALKSPVALNTNSSPDFHLLFESTGYQNSLLPGEYKTETHIEADQISARAFFEKSLPFEYPYLPARTPFLFMKTPVQAFGKPVGDYADTAKTKILYYQSDEKFILSLIPKDSSQEIIVCKGVNPAFSFRKVIGETDSLIRTGMTETKSARHKWKYILKEADELWVPDIHFNLYKNYSSLIDQEFTSGNRGFIITTAYQETAFSLNQRGAIVASASMVSVAAVDTGGVKSIEHPKKLLLDKPFFILLRNKKRGEPYFMLKVDNTEILNPLDKKDPNE